MNRKPRIQAVRQGMEKDGCDAFLITNLPNIFYVSGFRGSDGALLITKNKQILLVDGRYGTQGKQQAPECDLVVYAEKVSGIVSTLLSLSVQTVGFQASAITVELAESLKSKLGNVSLKPIGNWISMLRKCKDADEIALLKRANKIADDSAREILSWIKPGVTEEEIANELEYRMKKKGAERASFSILVAGGDRAALPHAMPTNRKVKKNELFFLDFGCTLEGYQTDQTLTIPLGKIDPKWEKIYAVVKDAHDKAIEILKPGVKAKDLDFVARKYISDQGFGDAFSHSLGHGVGVEVHEYPPVSSRSEAVIEEGMVLTVEPGIYLPNQGGVRIEDTLLVTSTGSETLTTVDKTLRSL